MTEDLDRMVVERWMRHQPEHALIRLLIAIGTERKKGRGPGSGRSVGTGRMTMTQQPLERRK